MVSAGVPKLQATFLDKLIQNTIPQVLTTTAEEFAEFIFC
jgi:hypothetical protein